MKHPELLAPYAGFGRQDLGGVEPPVLPFLLAAERDPCELVIVSGKRTADHLVNDLLALECGSPILYVGRDLLDGLDSGRSAAALRALLDEKHGLYVSTPHELLGGVNPRGLERMDLHVGMEITLTDLETTLQDYGFERESFVVEPGAYALRGGVLDVFPGEAQHPIRLDFLGNTLESAHQFDPATQRSEMVLEKVTLFSQEPYGADSAETLLSRLPSRLAITLVEGLQNDSEAQTVSQELTPRPGMRRYSSLAGEGTATLQLEEQPDFQRNLEAFRARLDFLSQEAYQVYLAADSSVQAERLLVLFKDYVFTPIVLSLSRGFIDHGHRLAVLTDHQVFGRSRKRSLVPRLFPSRPVTASEGFSEGEYVVHLDYGIGRYLGVELIPVSGKMEEVLAVQYENEDRIYVPVDRLDRLHKYESSAGVPPRLTRLRTTEWDQVKLRTRTAVDNYARELMELYAHRFVADGHSFPSDDDLQRQMEAAFVFTETRDQLTAVAEIKQDMESGRPMDRLLCGDVGFGKTEVALRAAFKAVSDSFQVGVLVPTTILAQQHYETIAERLEGFPVRVEVISRFKSTSAIRRVLDRLQAGEVDILVGTHRMLSRDVQFRKLGLLIVDEEHRFGVKHKERIKELKTAVDCLSMTATPIPRTLQMSLMGARDMSTLKAPPRERQPIETIVTESRDETIRQAILREVDRGGQVFFVHNRVESIGIMLERLKHILPEIRFGLGHGQMKASELERVMLGFFHHEYDVLLSTTIIESGLDIPNANTIIVNRADAMGLSQLYQLRGRVGRSNRKAWAYFLSRGFGKLSLDAIKRLNALERHSHYGGGYEIAMRDLEIRGSGNVFGTEQSGHLVRVGYHLYTRILQETLERLRDQQEGRLPRFPKPDLSLDQPALLPRDYIEDAGERLAFYRRLSEAAAVEGVDSLARELRERFGQLPEQAVTLVVSSAITVLGRSLGIRTITQKGARIQCDFHTEHVEQAGPKIIQSLSAAMADWRGKVELMNNAALTFLLVVEKDRQPLEGLRIFLECMG